MNEVIQASSIGTVSQDSYNVQFAEISEKDLEKRDFSANFAAETDDTNVSRRASG